MKLLWENLGPTDKGVGMKKVLQFFIILFTIFTFFGCFRAKNFEERVNRIVKELKKELSLNDEQTNKLESIRLEIIAKQKSIKANLDIENIKNEVLSMIKSEQIDKEKFKKTIEPLAKSRQEMIDFVITKMIEFHRVLTPEQRNKLAELMEKFDKKMEKNVGD